VITELHRFFDVCLWIQTKTGARPCGYEESHSMRLYDGLLAMAFGLTHFTHIKLMLHVSHTLKTRVKKFGLISADQKNGEVIDKPTAAHREF
jgi:hypothetical protein